MNVPETLREIYYWCPSLHRFVALEMSTGNFAIGLSLQQ
jgi:hypothetical protein